MTPKELALAVRKREHQYNAARLAWRTELRAVREAAAALADAKQAQAVAQGVAERVQAAAHARVADIVSRALEAVFDRPYRFKLEFEQKRGRTEAALTFERDGLEIDPLEASGGGVIDVASFALRLSCLLLSRPPLRRLIVADEPFRFVSKEYRGRVRALLETLAVELGVQFIIVTHDEALVTGTIVQL